jgi:hypothetical protein
MGIIQHKLLAGTGSKLGLVKFDGHRIIVYFGECAGMGINVGTDFAKESSTDNKFIWNEDVKLICGDCVGTNLFFCAEGDGVFFGVDFADVEGNATSKADASSLAEGEIGNSFMFGNFIAPHIRYVAGLMKGIVGQDCTIVAFSGEAEFHAFRLFSNWQVGFGGN